jgi:hypothetical protein
MYWQKWSNIDYCEELYGSMDIQWGWREDNGDILRDQVFEGLPAIPNIEKRVQGKASRCFIDFQEEEQWICFATTSWIWWKGKCHNFFLSFDAIHIGNNIGNCLGIHKLGWNSCFWYRGYKNLPYSYWAST